MTTARVARLRQLRPAAIDVLVGCALAIGSVLNLTYMTRQVDQEGFTDPDVWAFVLALVQTLPVMWRRIAPTAVLAVASAGFVVARLVDYPVGIEVIGLAIGLFAVALEVDRRRSPKIAWPFILGITAFTALGVLTDPDLEPLVIGVMFSTLLLPYLLGRDAHERRARAEAAEQRATDMERNQEAMRSAAVQDERTRIARELHDVVAHNMTVMTIQAAAARRVLDQDPDRAAEALEAIEEAGHGALIEMRRMLGVLRTEGEQSDAAPQPGLARLDALAEEMREAGLDVDVVTNGSLRPLSPGVDLNAYRIIQESLTNALRHGGPDTSANVSVFFGDEELTIEVSDDGRGIRPGAGNGSGQGLVGMKERAALLDGSLAAGPKAGGGFRVRSTLPISR